jgi:aspartyl-tRNA(Asn)/glutamyl-tRNA(Gln) amidotransferase subunit B
MTIPETPLVRAARLSKEWGIETKAARQIVLTDWALADLFEMLAAKVGGEAAMSWAMGPLSSSWRDLREKAPGLRDDIIGIIVAVTSGKMTDSEGRMRISALSSGQEAAASGGEDVGDLDSLIVGLVDEHPEVVRDYQSNERAANFLIGQVMKAMKGRYSSKVVAERMKRELEKRV